MCRKLQTDSALVCVCTVTGRVCFWVGKPVTVTFRSVLSTIGSL